MIGVSEVIKSRPHPTAAANSVVIKFKVQRSDFIRGSTVAASEGFD
jgi:hypothetical protein